MTLESQWQRLPLRFLKWMPLMRVLSPTEDIVFPICFENGCVANLSAGQLSEKKAALRLEVFQDSGYLSLDFMNQRTYNRKDGMSFE